MAPTAACARAKEGETHARRWWRIDTIDCFFPCFSCSSSYPPPEPETSYLQKADEKTQENLLSLGQAAIIIIARLCADGSSCFLPPPLPRP